jgi:hypothetical protein
VRLAISPPPSMASSGSLAPPSPSLCCPDPTPLPLFRYQQLYFPYLSGHGIADAAAQNASIRIGALSLLSRLIPALGFKLVRVPRGTVTALAGPALPTLLLFKSLAHHPSTEDEANSPDAGYMSGETLYGQHPQIKEEVEKCRGELLSASSTKDFRAQLKTSASRLSKLLTPPALTHSLTHSREPHESNLCRQC